MKINKHIEIVCSTIKSLSSMSKESRGAIHAVLKKHYTSVGITIVNNLADLEALVEARPDLVFLGMKFIPRDLGPGLHSSEKIWLTEYFDQHGITYTGSGHRAHNLELNKPQAKQRVLEAGFDTSPYAVVEQNNLLNLEDTQFNYPLFVKPTNRGGGLGVDTNSVVRSYGELKAKVTSITVDLHSDALIEQYLSGREFSVAILKDNLTDRFSVMPIELVAAPDTQGFRLLSAEVKSSNQEAVSAVVEQSVKSQVCSLALNVFNVLDAQDYGRVDIRMDEQGKAYFLEANLLPSLISGYGSFPKACEMNLGLGYEDMILRIVELALARESFEEVAEQAFIGTSPYQPAIA